MHIKFGYKTSREGNRHTLEDNIKINWIELNSRKSSMTVFCIHSSFINGGKFLDRLTEYQNVSVVVNADRVRLYL
jgi:hypothetical protein